MDQSLIPWARDLLWLLLVWVLALFLVVAGVYMTVGPALRQGRAQRRVARALEAAGLPALHDLVLRGPRGGLQQVDHVVRLPTGFVVLETCMRSGRLVGRPRGRVWRQEQGLDTYRFGNPLRRLGRAMAAVQAALPDPVAASDAEPEAPLLTGQVLVPNRAHFPRGRPDGVSPLGPFLQDLRAAAAAGDRPTPAVRRGWAAMQAAGLTAPEGDPEAGPEADADGPAWRRALRRTLRHLMADHRTAAGVLSTVTGGLLVLLLGVGLIL